MVHLVTTIRVCLRQSSMGRLTRNLQRLAGVVLLAATVSAQNFDTSGNGTLHGDYFVREVLISGQNPATGTLTSAASAIGVVTFDGNGNYTFAGQVTSTASGSSTTPLNGTYQVGSNGLMNMTSLADQTDIVWGGVAAIGPSAFVASATEGSNVDIMIAIPAGSNVTNSALKGSYAAGAIDFLNADVTMVRDATFTLNPDGAGNLGALSVSGAAEDLGGTATTQTVTGATYSLSGEGSGTASFGAAASTQLVSGTKTFYISADGNIVLGGSPTGYDLLVGIRSLSGTATNATANSLYYIAGLENSYESGITPPNAVDAFYGSAIANGAGTTLFHNRFQNYSSGVYDYTFDGEYTVQSNGTITPDDLPWYQFTLGVNGQAYIATGLAPQGLYSLVVGFAAPTFSSGTGVYLKPTGVVNAGNFAPITNPIAPNEFITLFGSGLANSTVSAPKLPLPTSLGGVTVTINNVPAPLLYVSADQIEALVPASISPNNQVLYASVQVTNNKVASNPVTVYTSNTAPGVFALGEGGIGAAAAQDANAGYTTISAANPANVADTVVVYLTGLGAVSSSSAAPPAVGSAAPSSPLFSAIAPVNVDFNGVSAAYPDFAGLTPAAAGLYQINEAVPAGAGPGDTSFDLSTPDAYASQATVNISGSSQSSARFKTRRVRWMRPAGTAGAKGRTRSESAAP
jgi:uncharacterized protein (TIGR03437 family)